MKVYIFIINPLFILKEVHKETITPGSTAIKEDYIREMPNDDQCLSPNQHIKEQNKIAENFNLDLDPVNISNENNSKNRQILKSKFWNGAGNGRNKGPKLSLSKLFFVIFLL